MIREADVIAAVRYVEWYVGIKAPVETELNRVKMLRESCLIARFAAVHFTKFSLSVKQNLVNLHSRLKPFPASEEETPLQILLRGLRDDLGAMSHAVDQRAELEEWEVVWIAADEVQELEVQHWIENHSGAPALEHLHSQFSPSETGHIALPPLHTPKPPAPKPKPGALELRLARGMAEMLCSLIADVDWGQQRARGNPLFDKLWELGAQLGYPLILGLGSELVSPGRRAPKPQAEATNLAELSREKELLAIEITEFLSRFSADYVLGIDRWEKIRSAQALKEFIPLIFEYLSNRVILPLLDSRPRSLSRDWHQHLIFALEAVNNFLEDYQGAFEELRSKSKDFDRLMVEEQERLLIATMVTRAQAKGVDLPCAQAKDKRQVNRRQRRAVRRFLKPYMEAGLPQMPELIQGLLSDFPKALPDLLVCIINAIASPSYLALVLERILDHTLPKLEAAFADKTEEQEAVSTASFGELEKSLGLEIRRLAESVMAIGETGGWLRGAYMLGGSILSRFESMLGQAVHGAIDTLIAKDTLCRSIQAFREIYWKRDGSDLVPVFRDCYSLSEADALKLRMRIEPKIEGRLHRIICGAARGAGSRASLAVLKTDAVKDTCSRLSSKCFDLLWQPALVQVFLYDYLISTLAKRTQADQ